MGLGFAFFLRLGNQWRAQSLSKGCSRVTNQSSVTGIRLIFSIDKLLNRWQVMHYNEQLPFIEIIVLKCLKIDIFPKKRGVPEPLEPSLCTPLGNTICCTGTGIFVTWNEKQNIN